MTSVASSLTRIGDLTEEGTSRTIEAGGMTIHYHDIGTGFPIVMLHSYGLGTTSWITWFKVFPELSKHFRLIAMDLPNFAKTGPIIYNEPIHTFQAMTAHALMDALGIEKAHLVGNSQGGQTAMVFAYMYPDRVEKLVWGAGHIGTRGGYIGEYTFTVKPEASGFVNQEAMEDPSSVNFRRYLKFHIRDEASITDELVEYVRHMYTYRPDMTDARAKSGGEPHNHLYEMSEIKAPTLMIWGRYDRTCNFEIGFNSLNRIRNSRLVILHCGHWVPFEMPDEYTSHVMNFLQGDWAT
jgi:2-hydroxy-6-oxonona-2,4-dienedioate hydrolase